ncbi:UvrD-helicase domain-containing protein [Winogradskyella sp. A3E31]|uniref:UvrD-helicase domain-containing protein n=1 Tax=Winogradskyella sp. A3E31 TaxID=3349637 RepID=UPI00398A8506
MAKPNFTIYNASAGSGKTYTLAKSYLKILLSSPQPNAFRHILAITFTNKAVNEMKQRIISMLKAFSSEESLSNPNSMFKDICKELNLSPEQLHSKSEAILNQIIHNYAAFDISTIDGFTHRVIRTFAFDLKLPVNFEVVLEQDDLLNKAVDNLIAKAGSNPELTKVLVDFAIEKADDDKSWDIAYDFKAISKLLVQENDLKHVKTLKDKTLEDFKALKNNLRKQIKASEKNTKSEAESVLTSISEAGLEHNDFKSGWLPKYFLKLTEGNFSPGYTAGWQNDLVDGNELYPKRVSETIAETINTIQPQIAESFLKTKHFVFNLKFLKAVLKNITPLSVLNAIQKELEAIKVEENKLLISEFNALISDEIKDQPTPFIYERLGEKFQHYFIDEFQDTSTMQWQNLVPLISNKLEATDGSLMLLGDAKQSIYRWRGGEAEQFIDLYQGKSNPFQIEATVKPLDKNFRSTSTIVEFNNVFFDYISGHFFEHEDYIQLYKDSRQTVQLENEGYVNLSFLNIEKDDDRELLYCQETLTTINECLKDSFELGEICVLVRKKKEGIAIAEYLSQNDVPIVSSETLLLNNSPKVRFLVSVLEVLNNPNDEMRRIECLHFMADLLQIENTHLFFERFVKLPIDSFFSKLEDFGITLSFSELLQMPLYETAETLIRAFNLVDLENAYMQFFLDLVFDFAQKKSSDLQEFLHHFDDKKEKLSIAVPLQTNAVQIMTIHKAKGLEFPIVIFPFADLDFYREKEAKEWFPLDANSFNGFETALLNYNQDFENYGAIGEDIYNRHQSQLKLDAINLLYVTFTRAAERLYIISKKDLKSNGEVNKRSYAGLLIEYLQHENLWNDNQDCYDFGKKAMFKKTNASHSIELAPTRFISTPKESHNLNIITQSGYLWDTDQGDAIEKGNLIHLILSKIKTQDDFDLAFDELINNGTIKHSAIEDLKKLVTSVITNDTISEYYSDEYTIYNEKDIITRDGGIFRPDRIAIRENNAIVIDYKTGAESEAHKSQIESYANQIKDMGYTVSKKILVYTNDALKIVNV